MEPRLIPERKPVYNSIYLKGGISRCIDSPVVRQTFVFKSSSACHGLYVW